MLLLEIGCASLSIIIVFSSILHNMVWGSHVVAYQGSSKKMREEGRSSIGSSCKIRFTNHNSSFSSTTLFSLFSHLYFNLFLPPSLANMIIHAFVFFNHTFLSLLIHLFIVTPHSFHPQLSYHLHSATWCVNMGCAEPGR